jgi:hypothetical protein
MNLSRWKNSHFHPVVETPRANLVPGMKWRLGGYEQTESWPGRIIETQQTRLFGFSEFSAL